MTPASVNVAGPPCKHPRSSEALVSVSHDAPKGSIKDMYPDMQMGLVLLTAVKKDWRVRQQVRLDFFDEFGNKTFVVDSCNDRHQPLVIEQYVDKIVKFGNCQEVRGGAVACLSDGPGGGPRRMLTYGTLVRAIYLAAERHKVVRMY